MLVSVMIYILKLTKALLSYSFELNPYDPCVSNEIVNGEQPTICWHVDDLKSSHIDPKVNDKILKWIKDMFGQLSEVKTTQGPLHDYLGMTLDYSVPGQVSINRVTMSRKWSKNSPKRITREHQWTHHGMITSSRYNMTVFLLKTNKLRYYTL